MGCREARCRCCVQIKFRVRGLWLRGLVFGLRVGVVLFGNVSVLVGKGEDDEGGKVLMGE